MVHASDQDSSWPIPFLMFSIHLLIGHDYNSPLIWEHLGLMGIGPHLVRPKRKGQTHHQLRNTLIIAHMSMFLLLFVCEGKCGSLCELHCLPQHTPPPFLTFLALQVTFSVQRLYFFSVCLPQKENIPLCLRWPAGSYSIHITSYFN